MLKDYVKIKYNKKMDPDSERLSEDGIERIHNNIVKYVLEFLKTGVFRNKTTNAYMTAYQ